jgi:hypothetical protein
MPKGKYYEYQIKRSALDQDYLSGNIDDFQYARESLDVLSEDMNEDWKNNNYPDQLPTENNA